MHIYFSDLRRVLTHSKIDRIWIIYFTTHKMFANFTLNDLNLIRCWKNIIEHIEIVPEDLVWLNLE